MSEETFIETTDDLRALLGEPIARVRDKDRDSLHPLDVEWIGASPFVLLATADADGNCDVSPRGDPPGSVKVLGLTVLALPERPGNKRADSLLNVLANPHVGLLFLIPGRNDTLRVNGRARIVRDAAYFDDLEVKGHRPSVVLRVDIAQVFYHCAKAFMRSQLWAPQTWAPDAVPARPHIAKAIERPESTMEELEAYYGPSYAEKLYRG
jgi:PPOX class probable FMN-dependent enzyme